MMANDDNGNDKKRGRDSEAGENTNGSEENSAKVPREVPKKKMDSFLMSMTFATNSSTSGHPLVRGGCDCDECGNTGGYTPQAIVDAIRKHKRLRKETGPMKRSQLRELVQRHGTVSMYKFTMPIDAEPLVEYGTSHRILWIRQLPTTSILQSIGKGIVGSQDEEKGRTELTEWKEGDVCLVPSNGGKAIAWIHSQMAGVGTEGDNTPPAAKPKEENGNQENNNENTAGGHAIIYIIKVPKENLDEPQPKEDLDEEEGERDPWHEIVRRTCKEEMEAMQNGNNVNQSTGGAYKKLSESNSRVLLESIAEF